MDQKVTRISLRSHQIPKTLAKYLGPTSYAELKPSCKNRKRKKVTERGKIGRAARETRYVAKQC